MEYPDTAESEIVRVVHIAKQTLGFDREHPTASSSSVVELAQHAITIYEPRCALNGITLEKSLRSMKKIVLRRGEMMQVISNLIANSLYASLREVPFPFQSKILAAQAIVFL
jgi:signal transduction histidine kinase